MQFFYKGSKKHNNTIDFFSGCAVFIGFAAFIFFLTLLDDLEDLADHAFEIIMFVIIAVVTIAAVFTKKAKLHSSRLEIKDNSLRVKKDLMVLMSKVQLDVYKQNATFIRYHLYDMEGKIAIFSAFEDDLLRYFEANYSERTQVFQVQKTSGRESVSYVYAGPRLLSYNLSTGKYAISDNEQLTLSKVPEFYSYDGKYKAGQKFQ
ncbi:hypothetical protein [Gilvibacter sp. SZ-19]|uniref:hypothetical protein n=1 Tax=Gilvibacter sp. SZ-19 TaxID=754429 RepID=UPI0012FC588A|nr:hypothetical protein [Gilvibacter sp. SZ-19]